MAEKAAKVDDIKFYLAEEDRKRQQAELIAKRERERQQSLGTLEQLFEAYREKMKSEDRSSWNKVYKSFERYVIKPYPDLAKRKANEITSDDIADILGALHDRGITTTV